MNKEQDAIEAKKRMKARNEELKALGLVRLDLWVDPSDVDFLKSYDKKKMRASNKPGRKTDSKK